MFGRQPVVRYQNAGAGRERERSAQRAEPEGRPGHVRAAVQVQQGRRAVRHLGHRQGRHPAGVDRPYADPFRQHKPGVEVLHRGAELLDPGAGSDRVV